MRDLTKNIALNSIQHSGVGYFTLFPLSIAVFLCPFFPIFHRYGREDEEVMGLKFCNEAIIALKQIWPISNEKEPLSPLQVSFDGDDLFNLYHACDVTIFFLDTWGECSWKRKLRCSEEIKIEVYHQLF